MDCKTGSCGGCSNCGGCSGCSGGSLTLSPQEIQILEQLGIYAFLPVSRKADTMEPHCREAGMPEDATLALQLLEKKALIEISYDRPMGNFDYKNYQGLPVRGSVGLTQRGQQVLELLEIQGIS